jgi:hypothetical protein
MANFTCDNVTLDIPNDQVATVATWIQKRDAAINELSKKAQLKTSKRRKDRKDDPEDGDPDDEPWIIDEGMEYDDADKMAMAFKKQTKDYNAMKDELQSMKDEMKAAQKDKKDAEEEKAKDCSKMDGLKGEVEALKLQLATRNDANQNSALKERIRLHNQAIKHLPSNFNADSLCDLTERQIKEQVIEDKWPSLKDTFASRSDGEIDGLFLGATFEEPKHQDSTIPLRSALSGISSNPNNPNNFQINQFNHQLDGFDDRSYLREIETRYLNPNA